MVVPCTMLEIFNNYTSTAIVNFSLPREVRRQESKIDEFLHLSGRGAGLGDSIIPSVIPGEPRISNDNMVEQGLICMRSEKYQKSRSRGYSIVQLQVTRVDNLGMFS